jgi:hypothetical protein
MTNTGRLFLECSRSTLAEQYWPRMRQCVESLTAEQVWWRPNAESNSIGNLMLRGMRERQGNSAAGDCARYSPLAPTTGPTNCRLASS